MHETAEDLLALRALLDSSNERAGEHYKRITTPERRLDAAQVTERLTGMTLRVLDAVEESEQGRLSALAGREFAAAVGGPPRRRQ